MKPPLWKFSAYSTGKVISDVGAVAYFEFKFMTSSRFADVADTLGSVHTRHETPICQESTMQNNTLSL